MKKIYLILAAASVVLAASCNKEEVSSNGAPVDSMVVKFTAKVADTKTVFNPASYESGAAVPVLWEEGDKLDVYINEKVLPSLVEEIEVTPGAEDKSTASWECDFASVYDGTTFGGYVPDAPYTFYAFCPGEKTRAFYNASESRILVEAIPAEQTPSKNSCDKSAIMLYSVSESYDTWPSEVVMPEFTHMTAYGCITLGDGIPAEANVTKVTVTANEGQYLAGNGWYYYAGENKGTWKDYSKPGTETITINTTAKENIWFGCRPTTDLASLTFVVTTDQGDYQVTKDLAERNFTAGKIAKMTVDGFEKVEVVEPDPNPEAITYVWTADDAEFGFVTGTANDLEGLTWNDKVVSQTFAVGTPALDWTVDATAAGTYNVSRNSVTGSVTGYRIKFGSGDNIFDPVVLTITPTEGYNVKTITAYVSVNKATSNYKLTAKVGETVFVDNQTMESSKKPAAITGSVDTAVSGNVEIIIDGETADVFYLYKLELVLVK